MTLDTIVHLVLQYRYAIIFPLAIIEGPIIMMLSGILLRLDYVSFYPVYLTLMAGDLCADVLWYGVGYHGGHPLVRKYGHFVGIDEDLVSKTEEAFHRHQNKILFLSKITMGFGFALVILITAGIARIPFRKYLAFNAIGQLVWTGVLIALGYFFGGAVAKIDQSFQLATVAALTIVVLLVLGGINRTLRKRDLENRL